MSEERIQNMPSPQPEVCGRNISGVGQYLFARGA